MCSMFIKTQYNKQIVLLNSSFNKSLYYIKLVGNNIYEISIFYEIFFYYYSECSNGAISFTKTCFFLSEKTISVGII